MHLCDLYALFHRKGRSYSYPCFTLRKLCLRSHSTGFMADQMHTELKLKPKSAWSQGLSNNNHSDACVVLVFLKPGVLFVQIHISKTSRGDSGSTCLKKSG